MSSNNKTDIFMSTSYTVKVQQETGVSLIIDGKKVPLTKDIGVLKFENQEQYNTFLNSFKN